MFIRLVSLYQRFAARRMFSRWSPIYEEEVTENAYSAANEVASATIRHIGKKNITNPAIADIGIGTGLLAQQLFDATPCRITGLDFTEDMMAPCSGRGITELLIKCDVGKDPWPLENISQDFVVSAGLVEYMMPNMAQHFFKESRRVMQQNGILIFTYLPLADDEKQIRLWRGHSGTYLICGYTGEHIESLARINGFDVQEHSPPFKGCIFADGSSYDYRLLVAKKT